MNFEATKEKAKKFVLENNPQMALPLLWQLYETAPQEPEVVYNLALCLFHIGNQRDSLAYIKEAARLDPENSLIKKHLAIILSFCGNYSSAVTIFEDLINQDCHDGEVFEVFARTLIAAGQLHEARDVYQSAVATYPNDIQLLKGLGKLLIQLGQFSDAIKVFEIARDKAPYDTEIALGLGESFQNCGYLEAARDNYEIALSSPSTIQSAERALKFLILNLPNLSSKELFKIHLDLAEKYNSHLINPVFHETNGGSVKKKLKIGYVSSDFRLHVVAFNVLPLIENHDTEKFTTFLYSNVRNPDHITDKFRSLCDCWRPIEDLSDQAAAKLIEADKIDILIYLAGRFDSNRPEISIYRPAPIQISFHDCATTGLKSIDYWLTDGLLHPQDTQELFVEKLCRLPIFYQYHVLQEAEVDETLPADVKGEITFGCFNKPEKINEEVICLWSKILLHFPNSKLMLKYFNHYSDQIVCNRIKLCFEKYGVAEDRLCFESGYDVRRDHLKYYKRVDICLDPFPFNGATTTFEALSMNVPVIALWGRHFVDRVAATMLTQAGFPELAANDLEEYFLITAQLAADIPRLMNYRKSLRRSLLSSPLCENRTYAKNVENVYLKMWQSLNDAS